MAIRRGAVQQVTEAFLTLSVTEIGRRIREHTSDAKQLILQMVCARINSDGSQMRPNVVHQ